MARVVNWVWIEAGDAPGISISGSLKIEFNTKDVVKARHLLEKLCELLGNELGSCEAHVT